MRSAARRQIAGQHRDSGQQQRCNDERKRIVGSEAPRLQTGLGLAIWNSGGLWGASVLASQLYGVKAYDPWTLAD
jgi:hypothetical protein